mgnify:CR=1 FL=1
MLRCSFCERTEDQVERIIYGASGCICNDCIVASYQMLMEQEDKTSGRKSKGKQKEDKYELIKPTELKKILDKYIIGQDEAKKTICVSVYNHYKKNFFGDEATADETVTDEATTDETAVEDGTADDATTEEEAAEDTAAEE